MKHVVILVSGILLASCSAPLPEEVTEKELGQVTEGHNHDHTEHQHAVYDKALAEKCGADEIGMKQYIMAFLKAGPNRGRSKEEENQLQLAHMENIGRMAEEGKLVIAGPFLDGGELRGIYIFDVKTIEEAQTLTASDPAIQAGSLVMELIPWYGSAALVEVNGLHERMIK